MTTRTFTRDQLDGLEVGDGLASYSVVHAELIDQRRWYDVHQAVFQHDGKLWRVEYRVGSTEEQEIDLWDDATEVTADEVEPYEETVTRYRFVAAGEGQTP